MQLRIGCIVEGHGERESIRILLERVGLDISPDCFLDAVHIVRKPRSKLVCDGEIERCVEEVACCGEPIDGIFVLIDADDDCPAQLGPDLLRRATAARNDIPISVVLAKHEYEAWFIASIKELAEGKLQIAEPSDPEQVSGAKQWVGRALGMHYSETRHQPSFTRKFDIAAARKARSFDKCYREIGSLIQRILA